MSQELPADGSAAIASSIRAYLSPVRWRQRWRSGWEGAASGWFLAAASVALFGVWRWWSQSLISPWWGAAALAFGGLLGLAGGLARRQSWQGTARAIDSHYRLKDRTITALQFASHTEPTPLNELQVREALARLAAVRAPDVVPFHTPRRLPHACVASLLAAAILAVSVLMQPVVAGPIAPLEVVVEQAARLDHELTELADVLREEQGLDPELKKLIDELKTQVEALRQPNVDQREALAKLSAMQSLVQEAQKNFDAAAIDEALKQVAEALALAEPFQSVAKSLQAGNHEQAAEQLEQMPPPQLDRQTEKAVREQLAKLGQSGRETNGSKISQAAEKMSECLSENEAGFREGAKRLASECRSQARRKKIADLLQKQCNCLSDCKSQCEGECRGSKPSKSARPSKTWGLSASGNNEAAPTPNQGAKTELKLTGKLSDDGESETETSQAPETKQQAARSYRENFEKYRQLHESALDSESIPLGHRQVIRKYFESIRPEE